jgi:transcription antitermination factor NusG
MVPRIFPSMKAHAPPHEVWRVGDVVDFERGGSGSPSSLAHRPPRRRAADDAGEPRRIDAEGVIWTVARVWSGRERDVEADLREDGFRAYCPTSRALALRARVTGTERRETRVRVAALFPGYLFVGDGGGRIATPARHERVIEVIGGERPVRVPAAMIAAINARELAGEFDEAAPVLARAAARSRPLKRGERVKFREGPFAGFEGAVSALPADLRVKVELVLFGRVTGVTASRLNLDRI